MNQQACRLTRAIAIALAVGPVAGGGGARADEVSILVEEAIASNPSVEAMRDRTRELEELASISDAWMDPQLSIEYSNAPVDTLSISDTPMGGVQFKLQQRLPEWGWTAAARRVADHEVTRSEHARAEAEVQLRRNVETLYWNLALSRFLEGVTKEHLARTLELLRAVRARYEVGKAGQNALLRLDVLRDRLQDDLGDFTRAERELSAGLARALARPPDSRFETPSQIEAVSPAGDLSTWLRLALKERPLLAAIREEIKLQDQAAALSRIRVRPEVDVWAGYRLRTVDNSIDDGTDFLSAGISVPIPWGSRRRGLGGEAASLAARDSARARLAATIDRIESELISVDASWSRAAEKARNYRETLIPAAHAALETTLNDFSVGNAEFSTLYEAEVDLLTLERAYFSATIETRLQAAAARAVTGDSHFGASR